MSDEHQPDPQFIAQQLRKPSGEFAAFIAEKMDEGNKSLFDLTLSTMELEDGESILEIGFGSGTFLKSVKESADLAQLCGIDYSQEMVKAAEGSNAGLVRDKKLKLVKGNSDSLPFDDGSFDKIFCNNVIYFWEEPEVHLREVWRVLKPGGRFYSGIRTKDSMEPFPFVKHGFRLYSREDWKKKLTENGFKYLMTTSKTDRPFEFDGEIVQLESMCVVGEKPA